MCIEEVMDDMDEEGEEDGEAVESDLKDSMNCWIWRLSLTCDGCVERLSLGMEWELVVWIAGVCDEVEALRGLWWFDVDGPEAWLKAKVSDVSSRPMPLPLLLPLELVPAAEREPEDVPDSAQSCGSEPGGTASSSRTEGKYVLRASTARKIAPFSMRLRISRVSSATGYGYTYFFSFL